MPSFTLKVNGSPRKVDLPADTPLLWVLRDTLGLTGTKFGCGQSLCGACTVHLDGEAVRSCVTTVAEAARAQSITTIEGLSPDRSHPVQQAWLAEDVPQCGYCQPGMIMSAAALLRKTPQPTDADIDGALGGHICRCGTYLRIRNAIHRAARPRSGIRSGGAGPQRLGGPRQPGGAAQPGAPPTQPGTGTKPEDKKPPVADR
jgi:aerobic-type carbon monoxide dehydrogenase small subunit (CoxS/CutS family)